MAKNGHKPGFKLPERRAVLVFEGDFEGAEITVRLGISLRAFFDLQRMSSGSDPDEMERAFADFSKRILIEWNLTGDDGQPIAPSLLDLPVDFASLIVRKYLEAVPNVPLVTATSEA